MTWSTPYARTPNLPEITVVLGLRLVDVLGWPIDCGLGST
jgi:hypothetical protein